MDRVVIEAANSILKREKFTVKKQNVAIVDSISSSSSSSEAGQNPTVSTTVKSSVSHAKLPFFVPRAVVAKNQSMSSNMEEASKRTQCSNSKSDAYPYNIEFRCLTISSLCDQLIKESPGNYQLFDTILCLSVSKWIHLNEGDAGLLNLFQVCFDLCAPGGRVVFEYQPWKSYKNKRNVSDRTREIFPTIQIRPEAFEDILTERFKFTVEARLGPNLTDARGYDRPILILLKPTTDICTRPSHDNTTAATIASAVPHCSEKNEGLETVVPVSDSLENVRMNIQNPVMRRIRIDVNGVF